MGDIITAIIGSAAPPGEEISASDINFDRTLPGLHRYLGSDLVDVGGRTHVEPESEVCMFAFYRSGVILVPGQTLPLIPYNASESALIKRISDARRSLIFLPGCFDNHASLEDFTGCVGTTADLTSIRIPDPEEHSTIHAIFVGRQRVRITKATRHTDFPLFCHGVILPEASLDYEMAGNPLGWGLMPRSWARFAPDPTFASQKAMTDDSTQKLSTGRRRMNFRYSYSASFRQSSERSAHKRQRSVSSSESTNARTLFPVPGHPLAMFNSRLSTWRRQPSTLSTGSLSSSPVSLHAKLDHFVEDDDEERAENVLNESAEENHQASSPSKSAQRSSGPPQTDGLMLEENNAINERQYQSIVGNSRLCPVLATNNEPTAVPEIETANISSECDMEELEVIVDRAVDRDGRPFRYKIYQQRFPRLVARRDVLATMANSLVSLPAWIYRQYDVPYLVTAIQAELISWNDTWKVDNWHSELAIPFSYWLVQNLPISGFLKAELLGLDHVVQRLRALLDIIRRCSACVCGQCEASVTSVREIICLAQEGSFQTYVNPSGVLLDMVTVSRVTRGSVRLVGSPSEEYSWFPGYSWTIANCVGCAQHLGWLFAAVTDELRPKQFWGIRRDAIVPGFINSEEWQPMI